MVISVTRFQNGANYDIIIFEFGNLKLPEFKIEENCPVSEKPLEALNIKRGVLIACINRNGKVIIPKGRDKIEVGDTVIIVTTRGALKDINDILEG